MSSADPPSWYHRFEDAEVDEASELYRGLADERRRVVLSVLDQRNTPKSESQLARLVAAQETGESPNAVSTADRERVQLSLHHVHLPHLEAIGLIEQTEDLHIACTQHPFWTTVDFRTLLTVDDDAPVTLTATFEALANRYRRAIMVLLKEQQALDVEEIAEELGRTPLSGQELPKLTAELVHCHLPKLEEARVVDVDSSESRIRYTGNVVLEKWFLEPRTQQEELEDMLMSRSYGNYER
ncbi:DUF7344 domain-containing protein [Natronorubrum halophilum]|uniref:DUF7344 domain-containing protein n=1 Tax=Natronorubrum halophilum TaxID=1702106 RepID=UPI0013CF174E|nr:hypothetical protein [Natronorubrum halophilum]